MRTLVGLLVLTLACSLAAAAPRDPQRQARLQRVVEIIEDLGVDDSTSGQLVPILSRYYKDHARLDDELADVARRLTRPQGPEALDKLYDEQLDTQRRLLALEARAVAKLRQILPAATAARARLMLRVPPGAGATASAPPPAPAPLPPVEATEPTTAATDPGPLFPPAARHRTSCDPFAAMHGCPPF